MNLEMLKIDTLVPYERNAKKHSPRQIDQIVDSIKQFGFMNPILIDSNRRIIAGHGRWEAARKMGMDTVPTIQHDHLPEALVRAYILADNRIAENAVWDLGMLALEIGDLKELSVDITGLGFNDADFAKLDFELQLNAANQQIPPSSGPGAPEVARNNIKGDFVAMNFMLTNDQRNTVVAGLNACKQRMGAKTLGEALVSICQEAARVP